MCPLEDCCLKNFIETYTKAIKIQSMDFSDILNEFKSAAVGPKEESENDRDEDLRKISEVWIKEKSVPELLPYENKLMDRLLERMRKQIEFIEINSIELQQDEREIKLLLVIVENELDRVQFLIRSYIRTRLLKIDKFSIFIRSDKEELAKLSPNETAYMEKHLQLLMDLYNSQFLGRLPENLQALDEVAGGISMVEKPDYGRPIFIKCNRDRQVVIDDEAVDLSRNGIYVLRYSALSDLVKAGEVMVL